MDSDNVIDTIHVWIGNTSKSREEFSQYFAINPVDRDSGADASQFDKDLNTGWYDDDLIGSYYADSGNSLDLAIDEIPATPDALREIQAKCDELNITQANAMFYYTNSELKVPDSSKQYNGLTYIGAFDNQ